MKFPIANDDRDSSDGQDCREASVQCQVSLPGCLSLEVTTDYTVAATSLSLSVALSY